MKKLSLVLLLSFSFSAFGNNNLNNKKLLCSKLLWGFEFISHNKVKVIETDINYKTKIKEYYYYTDLELSYINIYLNERKFRNFIYSIELNKLRVDIWTMTSGGITKREIIPSGFCEIVKIDNLYNYIQSLKNK